MHAFKTHAVQTQTNLSLIKKKPKKRKTWNNIENNIYNKDRAELTSNELTSIESLKADATKQKQFLKRLKLQI